MTRPTHYQKGDKIGGRFLVHQALRGGMGEVYLCLDTQERIPLALKTFIGTNPHLKDIFFEEVAKWVALERHPNIVRCHWMQVLDNRPFAAMDWIASDESRGTDLRSWIVRGKIDLQQALLFTVDIVRGLIHAGEKVPDIVHRDLKPENVLVNQAKQAKVNDFGLALVSQRAELSAESDATDLTGRGSLRVGAVVGTPLYMAPEQWRGEEQLDARTDMYAVGCILYELLTGEFAFQPPSGVSTQSAFLRAMADLHSNSPLPTLPAHFPPRLTEVLAGCLGKTYAERFRDLSALFAVLENVYQTTFDESLPTVATEGFTAIDYNNRGVTLSHLGQNQRAIEDLDRAIQLDPNYAEAYSNRGNRYSDLGQHQRAMEDYDHAIQLDPNFAQAYYNRGNSYNYLGQHQRAIDDYDRAIQLDPNYKEAYNGRGNSYADLGQHQQAITDYDRAIQLDPNLALVYSNRGTRYGALGQYQRAITDFDRAITLHPNLALAYFNRGKSYSKLGQHQRAITDYNEALRLDPNDTQAYYNRGLSYAALGQHQRAMDDYDRAIQLDPNYNEAYFNKGAALANTGHLQESLPLFEKAYALGLQQATAVIQQIHQRLGMAPAPQTNPAQAAFDAFKNVDSLDAMRQALQQHPILRDASMIQMIEQVIQNQVPAAARPDFLQKLASLKQLIQGG